MTRRSALKIACLATSIGDLARAAAPGIIIDTDVGSDDLMAIAFLLTRPEISIEAITTANGLAHVDRGATLVLRLLELAGRPDIPVYIGRPEPLAGHRAFPEAWRRDSDGLPGVELPQPTRKPRPEPATGFLAARLAQHTRPVRILALGPLTNLAEVIRRDPGAASTIENLVIMGGALHVPGNLSDGAAFQTANKTAEWNIYVDPLAASIVFDSKVPATLVPLDATGKVPIDMAFLTEFEKHARTKLGRFVAQVLESDRPHIQGGYYQAWDPLAAATLVHPGVCRTRPMAIEVRQRPPEDGRTVEATGRSPHVNVAMDADAGAFKHMFLAAF